MKNKAIKIAESFLRPPGSFGQTQRFIAENDIPKMVDQITSLCSGGVNELNNIKIDAAFRLHISPIDTKSSTWDKACKWTKDQLSHPTPKISEKRINELWEKHKGEFLAIFNRTDFETFIKELNNE